jgi:hypothetical protein
MATIIIEKRTRASITDTWGTWATTTDAPPYTNTTLIEYRSIDESFVTIEDLTANVSVDQNKVVTGTGVFDDVMETINKHIEAQYSAGRLKAENVATLYVGIVPTVLSESIKFLLQRKTNTQQLRVLEAQEALYIRQKEAFDDNKYQKLFEAQLNYNGMVFQDAENPDVLDVALEQKVNDVFNKLTLGQPIKAMPEV